MFLMTCAKLLSMPSSSRQFHYFTILLFQEPIKDAHAASKAILDLVGVVDHGLFLDMVDVCIIAAPDGVKLMERKKK